ncbi:hypothetical protein SAMN04488142_2516 [Halomonas sp. hl-4]|nr:hypothetical protein SAMN04488142_2516 [Halomonas sp. hl-4]
MSFWKKVKTVATSAKCFSGWHSGNYSQMKNKPKCHLEKTCPDCGEYLAKKNHIFTRWEHIDSFTCKAERECLHCQHTESKMMHAYERVEKDPVNCKIIRRCVRCNDKQIGHAEHNWLHQSEEDIKNGKRKECKDCGRSF